MSYICPKIYPFDLLFEVCVLFSVSSFCLVFQMVIGDFTDIIDFFQMNPEKLKQLQEQVRIGGKVSL